MKKLIYRESLTWSALIICWLRPSEAKTTFSFFSRQQCNICDLFLEPYLRLFLQIMKTTVRIRWTRHLPMHKSSVTFSFLFLSIKHTSLCYSYKLKTTSTGWPMLEKSCSQNRTVEVLKWCKSSELTEPLCSQCKSFRPPVWMLQRTEKKAGNLFGKQHSWRTRPKNKMSEPAQRSVEHKNLLLVLLA